MPTWEAAPALTVLRLVKQRQISELIPQGTTKQAKIHNHNSENYVCISPSDTSKLNQEYRLPST